MDDWVTVTENADVVESELRFGCHRTARFLKRNQSFLAVLVEYSTEDQNPAFFGARQNVAPCVALCSTLCSTLDRHFVQAGQAV
jgi:hypothetical protein